MKLMDRRSSGSHSRSDKLRRTRKISVFLSFISIKSATSNGGDGVATVVMVMGSEQGGKKTAKVGWHLSYGSGEVRARRPLARPSPPGASVAPWRVSAGPIFFSEPPRGGTGFSY